MGNKVSPNTFRLGIYRRHDSDWFAQKNFANFLQEDFLIRNFLKDRFEESAGIVKILISRNKSVIEVIIKCLQPSIIIGKKGGEINLVSDDLEKKLGCEVKIKIFDVKKHDTNSKAVALKISEELKRKGANSRRIIKRYIQMAMKSGVIGIRIECKGRLGGIEIARTDWLQEGAIPRQKLRANIDYASVCSKAKWGTSGVKVWIYNGDIVKRENKLGEKNVKS
ncbi:30S ribosomal protein S3 [Alphaproteobacteria bacterium endosymbiont of Tiliacea citrago]|uniref:30S ribosomal protein S3 n=1 Tax=Alphaproteobacteria bacterium endosymbiont of Tiliacea citrago TaxID=3077944 RepID=UPI00313AB3D3